MITVNYEVVSPAEVEIDGKQVTVAGTPIKAYYTTGNPGDAEKDEKAKARTRALFENMGLDPATINFDNIDTKPLLGLELMVLISPDEEEMRANPTAAELAKDKKAQGKVLKNPKTGAVLIDYWPKIREVFGLAATSGSVQVPY